MATFGYREAQLVGSSNIKEPKKFVIQPAQNAAWRRGDIVVMSTTGTITTPPAAASGANLATANPPGQTGTSPVTIVASAVTGAPAQTYYIQVTYTATGQETLPSQLYVFNASAGNVPSVNVSATGAPTGATNFAAYIGLLPGFLSLQQATKTTTALGTPYVAAYPLTNYQGGNKGATNLSANILGIADTDSSATYYDGGGGSFTAGTATSRLGGSPNVSPLSPTEAPLLYVVGCGYGQLFEFSLNQNTAYSDILRGTTAGIAVDATTGFPTIDPTQSNKIFTITDHHDGAYIGPTGPGTVGDLGARVIGYFNSGLLYQ